MTTYVHAGSTKLPVLRGLFLRAHIWVPDPACGTADDVLILEHRKAGTGCDTALVRLHSACLTGDVFGSLRCDCGDQLEQSLRRISEADWGIVAYLVGQEGRGIGLRAKLRAYALQDDGLDTIEANLALGLPVDTRDFFGAAAVLIQHGVRRAHLLTSNPAKVAAVEAAGIDVLSVERLDVRVNPFNEFYMATKQQWFERQRRLLDVAGTMIQDIAIAGEAVAGNGGHPDA